MEKLSEEVQMDILNHKANAKFQINKIFYNLSEIPKKEIKSMTKTERRELKDAIMKKVGLVLSQFIDNVKEHFTFNKFNYNCDTNTFEFIKSTTEKTTPVEQLFVYVSHRWTDWSHHKEDTLSEIDWLDYDIKIIKVSLRLKPPTLPFYWKNNPNHFARE